MNRLSLGVTQDTLAGKIIPRARSYLMSSRRVFIFQFLKPEFAVNTVKKSVSLELFVLWTQCHGIRRGTLLVSGPNTIKQCKIPPLFVPVGRTRGLLLAVQILYNER